MRKRFVTTIIICILSALCVFGFVGCSSDSGVKGKKFLLTDITLSFDGTVSEADKTTYQHNVARQLEDVQKGAEVFCNFYRYGFVTNYNGSVLCGSYSEDNGDLKIISYSPENLSFKSDKDTVTLTQIIDGVTLNYIFNYSGKITEYTSNSQVNFSGKTFIFVGLSQTYTKELTAIQTENQNKLIGEARPKMLLDYLAFEADGTYRACIRGQESSGTYVVQGNGKTVHLTLTKGESIASNFTVLSDDTLRYDYPYGNPDVNTCCYFMLAEE